MEVDVMLVGFDGNGAYHYTIDVAELEELLTSTSVEDYCPTVWDSEQKTSMCCSVTYSITRPLQTDEVGNIIIHLLT